MHCTAATILEAGFQPLTGFAAGIPRVELGSLYSRWWAWIDFFLFFALFAALARVTVGKHLEGREGNLVSIALGAILAVAASGLEHASDFNLGRLGPVAAALVLLVIAALAFLLIHKLGGSRVTAGAIAVVVAGVGTSSVSVGRGNSLAWVPALVQIGAVGAVGVLLYRLVNHARSANKEGLERLSESMEGPRGLGKSDSKTSLPPIAPASLGAEKKTVARRLRPITKKERKDSRRIIAELRAVRRILAEDKPTPTERQLVADTMARIQPRRHELFEHLQQVRAIDQALLRFDVATFAALRARVAGMSDAEKKLLHRLLLEERDKIDIENRIDRVERFVAVYDANAAQLLQRAAELTLAGRDREAMEWIDGALRYEAEAEREIERIRAVERMLLRLTKMEIRQEQRRAA